MRTRHPLTHVGWVVTAVTVACSAPGDDQRDPEESGRPPAPASVPGQSPAPAEPSLPQRDAGALSGNGAGSAGVLAILDELMEAPSARQWVVRHPADAASLGTFGPLQPVRSLARHTDWCLRGTRESMQADGSLVSAEFYFYPNPPLSAPPDYALPPLAEGPELLNDRCRLGLVTIVIEGSTGADSEAGVARSEAGEPGADLLATLTSVLGPGTDIDYRALPRLLRFGSASFVEVTTWTEDDMGVVWIRDRDGRPMLAAFRPAPDGPVAQAALPRTARWQRLVLTEAFEEAGLEPELRRTVDQLLALPGEGMREAGPPSLESVVSELTAGALDGSRGEQESARLLIADILLGAVQPGLTFYSRDTTETREARMVRLEGIVERFGAMGARYWYSEIGGEFSYARSLLDSAIVASPPPGEWGDAAALVRLEETCPSVEVAIRESEDLLTRAPNPAVEARLHYLLGDAHSTIVALSMGAGDIYASPDEYLPIAEESRTRAIEHYRRAFELPLDPVLKEHRWLNAWRIAANLMPLTRFFCVYD